jgi:nucleotide-binding universal stress UspA family protein
VKVASNHLEFHRILVPVTGTDADYETMRLACRIAKTYKSKLYAVFVITIKRSLPLEAEITSEIQRSGELLDRIENVARQEDYQVEASILQAREVAPAIINEANEKNIDLILMGTQLKKRYGQFSLGNIVPYVLKNATCRVMLYSQYNKETG